MNSLASPAPLELSLAAHVHRWSSARFARGSWDCVFFVGDWLRLARGVDLLARLRGRVGGRKAQAALAALGGLEAACLKALADFPRVDPADQRPGDVGLIMVDGEITIAIAASPSSWVVKPAGPGLMFVALVEPIHIWRVCRESGHGA